MDVNVPIQLPLTPNVSNNNGPMQQALAPIPARTAANNVFLFVVTNLPFNN